MSVLRKARRSVGLIREILRLWRRHTVACVVGASLHTRRLVQDHFDEYDPPDPYRDHVQKLKALDTLQHLNESYGREMEKRTPYQLEQERQRLLAVSLRPVVLPPIYIEGRSGPEFVRFADR